MSDKCTNPPILVGACNAYATDGRVCNKGTTNCTMAHTEAPRGHMCWEVTGIDRDPHAKEWSGR